MTGELRKAKPLKERAFEARVSKDGQHVMLIDSLSRDGWRMDVQTSTRLRDWLNEALPASPDSTEVPQ